MSSTFEVACLCILKFHFPIEAFSVTATPPLSKAVYVDFLEGKVVTSGLFPSITKTFLLRDCNSQTFFAESALAKIVGLPLFVFATSTPEVFSDPEEVVSLTLPSSYLLSVPEKIGT